MSPIQEARLALELPMLEESSVISPKSQRPKSKCSFTFLGDADGTTSHADSQSIYTCIYEVLGLRSSDYYSETERLMREGPVAESIISPRSVLSSLTIASNDL
jgi:hypothetical protein